MHRQPLLQLLSDYQSRNLDEHSVVERFEKFVNGHEDCFKGELLIGHITGSAWVLDAAQKNVLLTHHRKLNIWVQPGGHADGDSDVGRVAMKEAEEETGLSPLSFLDTKIFDLDIHAIPERKGVPEHWHYDVRFALIHSGDGKYAVSEESHDLAWVPLDRMDDYTDEESMLRMVRKTTAT